MTSKNHLEEMTGLTWTPVQNSEGSTCFLARFKRKQADPASTIELRPSKFSVPKAEAREYGYGFGCNFLIYKVYVNGELVNAALSNEIRWVLIDVLSKVRTPHAR